MSGDGFHCNSEGFKNMISKCITVVAAMALAFTSFASESSRPNILLLMAEDMSLRVGAFGDEVAITPNLDELAAKGTRFPNTFTTAGVCAPSRTSHIMSMHQISVGGQHMRTRDFKESHYRAVPPPNAKAYPELLRQAGYYTFTNSKLDYQFSDITHGTGPFTIWDYEGNNPSWKGRADGQPFFGFINFKQSHESQLFEKNVIKNREKGLGLEVVRAADVKVPPYYPDIAAVRKDIAQHYNNIHSMDKLVGDVIADLKKDGLDENTIIIWTTDHGDGLPRGKREIYDSGIRVPMIISWPEKYRPKDAIKGGEDRRLVSFVDLGPSILAMLGLSVPNNMHGTPQFGRAAETKRNFIFASKDRLDGFNFRERAVRSDKFHYIKNYMPQRPGGTHLKYRDGLSIMKALWAELEGGRLNAVQRFWFEPRPPEELYDISQDPHQVNNLAESPEYASQLKIMRNAYNDWRQRVDDLSDIPEKAMAQEFWPNGQRPETKAPEICNDNGTITIVPTTEGASIGYQIDGGKWQLYSNPISLKAGQLLTAKSVRYGWHESSTVKITL